VDVEHPEAMRWTTKARMIRASSIEDEFGRSLAQVASMIVAWSLTDVDTGEELPVPVTTDALDRLPAHVVEAILTLVGELVTVPKASGSDSGTG
tara:strand:- start:7917 stop:8198 length:282 start_codon:yes stop_codon:yes gene_type:complete